jgi:predicted RNA-binding Zn ribbon-like protein
MNVAGQPLAHAGSEPPMLGDHLALDLLNTEAQRDGAAIDYWDSGAAVCRWLAQHGLSTVADSAPHAATLLAQGKALRAVARKLIVQYKDKQLGDTASLEPYLRAYLSAPHLARDSDGRLTLTRVAHAEPVAALLGPVAEAVAQLLVDGDVTLVKQCEHPDCVLWFYDRTKAHKRRWCSMALCGNRYKAAQFRKKGAATTA